MAKFSTGMRDAMIDGSSAKALLTGCVMRIYEAPAAPADADAAETGTLLMVLSAGGTGAGFSFDAVTGEAALVRAAAQVWKTDAIGANGTMRYFRMVAPTDGGAQSTSAVRVQGTVGAAAGADMMVSNADVVAGGPWILNYFRLTLPTA